MTRWVDDFDAAASRCTSLDELKQLIDRAARDLGFDYFALLHHASVGDARRHLIRLDNYPAGWARERRLGSRSRQPGEAADALSSRSAISRWPAPATTASNAR
jgi:hypothetical protein